MYSIPEERAVFDAVMAKAPIGKLLDSEDGAHHGSDGSVEIF